MVFNPRWLRSVTRATVNGCVLRQCQLRKVTQSRESKPAMFTSHPTLASPPLFSYAPQALENQRERGVFNDLGASPTMTIIAGRLGWESGSRGL